MDRIDKKLKQLGFDQKYEGFNWCNYIRRKYEFDVYKGKTESDYREIVEIGSSFKPNGKIEAVLSAHLLGESCTWGHHHCSIPLTHEELKLFYKKMRKMELIWRMKDIFWKVKRRLGNRE